MPEATYILRSENFSPFVRATKELGYKPISMRVKYPLGSIAAEKFVALAERIEAVFLEGLEDAYGFPFKRRDTTWRLRFSNFSDLISSSIEPSKISFEGIQIAHDKKGLEDFLLARYDDKNGISLRAASLVNEGIKKLNPALFECYTMDVRAPSLSQLEPEIRKLFEEMSQLVPRTV